MTYFYAVTDCRADLIGLQAQGLRAFCMDPYRFVVLDNTPPDQPALSTAIRAEAVAWQTEYVKVPYTVQNRATANETHSSALCWAWREIICPRGGLAVLYDFDMFLCKPFSPNGWMTGVAISGWGQGKPPIRYYWPGLCFLDLDRMPAPETMGWDCGQVHGVPVDVGGQGHHYLAAHPDLPTLDLSCTARIETPNDWCRLPAGSLATYDPKFRVDVFNRAFVHYVGASGWDYPTEDLRIRKTAWIRDLVQKCVSGEWRMP